MAKNKRPDFFDFGWIVDENHPIKPKPTKGCVIDILLGVGMMLAGTAFTAISAFGHGAHAYEDSELNILAETGKLLTVDENAVEVTDNPDIEEENLD